MMSIVEYKYNPISLYFFKWDCLYKRLNYYADCALELGTFISSNLVIIHLWLNWINKNTKRMYITLQLISMMQNNEKLCV